MTKESFDWKNIPALAAYVQRVGAECLNFRRFMIKEFRGGYYTERALIKIAGDGTVSCSSKEHAPTEEEITNIRSALITEKFPRAILARDASVLRGVLPSDVQLFEFWSRREPGLIMCQERRVFADGRKGYVPWTFFSDGIWRMMEPDGALPFWKPSKEASKKSRLMIHEGAKAAAFADALVNFEVVPSVRHPWLDELSSYEHWGMIGGALAPHRADYDEVRREKPIEVVYVCDNDWAGKSALQEVSRAYGGALKGIMFDGRWPVAWDLADEMPKGLFAKGGRYIGPKLADLCISATRATERVPNPDGGKMQTVLRRNFREEWVHAITPEVFAHRDWPNRLLTTAEFNSAVAPFSDSNDTALLLKKDATSKTGLLKYDPGLKSGIYGGESGRYINTHVPGGIVSEQGDDGPWLEFMDHLVPDARDQHELLRWIATLVARPSVRMLYGVLLISETQGVGKGTLGEKILAPLVGESNVSYPSENEIVDSGFNYWLAHKRLAVVHEIYAGHSAKAYNRLKSVITDRYITVSKKYQANYEIENWMHVFACSNSMRAIQLSGDDRRWFVPRISEEKRTAAYWTEFNRWLVEDNGLGIIQWWCEEFLKVEGAVLSGAAAPWSTLKQEVVREGWSPGMAIVAEFLDHVKVLAADEEWRRGHCKPSKANGSWSPGPDVCVLDTDLVQLIKDKLYDGRGSDRLERPSTLRRLAKQSLGWWVADGEAWLKEWGMNGRKCRLLCSSAAMAAKPIRDISEEARPIAVSDVAKEIAGI